MNELFDAYGANMKRTKKRYDILAILLGLATFIGITAGASAYVMTNTVSARDIIKPYHAEHVAYEGIDY